MRQAVRRWLFSAGAMTAIGVSVLGQGGLAAASATGPARSMSRASASGYVPPHRVLTMGMHGAAVKALQTRLAELKYYPGPIDSSFGQDTIEAVWAFERVQGFTITAANSNAIGRRMEKALVHPRLPRVLNPRGGRTRVEVNQATQVLVLYRHNRIELISHVSTGGGYTYPCPGNPQATCGPAITPDGRFRAHWFARGWLKVPLGMMYNPVFFIGGAYAIHGDVPVPWYAVSHGCIRIPMDISQFFHKLIHISQGNSTPIYVHGHI